MIVSELYTDPLEAPSSHAPALYLALGHRNKYDFLLGCLCVGLLGAFACARVFVCLCLCAACSRNTFPSGFGLRLPGMKGTETELLCYVGLALNQNGYRRRTHLSRRVDLIQDTNTDTN